MDDGLLVPGKHDGMGVFPAANGKLILVRNHEMETTATEFSPFGNKRTLLRKIDRRKLYDAGRGNKPCLGGTTTLVYDLKEQRVEKQFMSLAGTVRNCAGGVTPWNTWITCEEDTSQPNADDDLRYQGFFERGAARFGRGEGIWYGKDGIPFACTNGGSKRKGQIWRYIPSPAEGTAGEKNQPGKLELFLEPNDGNLVENCDNVTIAPWGDLIVCEDGKSPQYLVGVTPEGKTYKIGKTTLAEFAGACFAPDGKTMFVNILSPGMTLAITGPWKQLRQQADA